MSHKKYSLKMKQPNIIEKNLKGKYINKKELGKVLDVVCINQFLPLLDNVLIHMLEIEV